MSPALLLGGSAAALLLLGRKSGRAASAAAALSKYGSLTGISLGNAIKAANPNTNGSREDIREMDAAIAAGKMTVADAAAVCGVGTGAYRSLSRVDDNNDYSKAVALIDTKSGSLVGQAAIDQYVAQRKSTSSGAGNVLSEVGNVASTVGKGIVQVLPFMASIL